jgi:peptidoglycan-N-acetylglucosamine deacetylase
MKRALIAAALLMSAAAMAEPKIAITVDDLPAHGVLPAGTTRVEVAGRMIAALKAAAIPPTYGLVNASLSDGEPAAAPVLKLWRDSGHLLGNHTFTHPGLSGKTVAEYEADITRNEPALEATAGASNWHWFRYPFLDEGKDAAQRTQIRTFLAGRGYKIAAVTLAIDDWDYPAPYARCLAKNDIAAVTKLEAMYLARAEAGLSYSRSLASTLYGRDIPYVLLLHIGAFQAHMMPKLIALYQEKGAGFVSLDAAFTDPYYRAYADPSLPAPPPNMEAALTARGTALPPTPANHGEELDAICR